MRAAFWWIDRWRASTAYTDMTVEQQGLYRNLLDEVWMREDHVVPEASLGKASGDPIAWEKHGPFILRWMKKVRGGYTNETALEVVDSSKKRAEKQQRYRDKQRNNEGNDGGNDTGNSGGSPSPFSVSVSVLRTPDQSPEPNVNSMVAAPAARPRAQDVFDYWASRVGRVSAKFTPKRERAVKARLKDGYTVERLLAAIDGCLATPWNRGENPGHQKYDDLELICRNGENVERFERTANEGLTSGPKVATTKDHNDAVMQQAIDSGLLGAGVAQLKRGAN